MKQFIKKITILFLILFSFTTYATSQYRETRRLLTEVQNYIYEKPDSAIAVLKGYENLASQDDGTEALYAMLITKAEYIATDSIASDSLIQSAVKYYNKEISLESAQASYYLGCYYFSRDKNKAAYSFQNSINFTPDGNNNHKGRAYHALGSCHFANGSIDEGVKAYEIALTLLDENENESTWQLCQDIKKALNEVNRVERGNALFALFVILTVLVVTGLCGFIYYKVKKSHMVKTAKTKFSDNPLEQMLLEGKSAFEQTSAYKTLQEIRSLNENELHSKNDIDVKAIEETILASFNDAYHILAECESKISHQDLMLCLYSYLKITNNVAAFCLNSVPGTIRQRKNRLKSKLPENVYIILFS